MFPCDVATPERKIWGTNANLDQRGQTAGVKHNETGRKYRLKTLGLNEQVELIKALVTKLAPQPSESEKDERVSDLLKPRSAMESEAKEQLELFEREQKEDR